MDAPADQSTSTSAPPVHSTLREAVRSPRRRRPTGAPPPLPYRLQTSGVGWLVAAVVLVGLELAVFGRGLRGAAVAVTVADDAVVRWLGGLHAPGLEALWQGLANVGSWWTLMVLWIGLVLALVVLRRWRHLIVWLVAWQLGGLVTDAVVGRTAQRARPFGVDLRTSWGGWAMPSLQITVMTAILMAVLYTLVPEGRWRNTGKWVAAGLVALVGVARVALGTDAPSDVLLAVGIGVTIPLLLFRRFTPSEVFPVTYRRGRSAHLDVGGERGVAIRRGLEDQLGLLVEEVRPFGLAGSGGSTPLRITVKGEPPTYLFAKLYALGHLRADRWYKLGRELLYGRLEDEKPFNSVRRLVQQEDYALSLMQRAGLPSPTPYGFVELTPDREYLLVTEFFDGAVELGEASVDDQVIDDGLSIIRRLWDAGLAHRDVKPANLLVRDGHLLPGAAQRCRAGLPAGTAPIQCRRDHRGVRGGPWAGVAVPVAPPVAGERPRPARRVHQVAAHSAPTDPNPAVERPPGGAVGSDRAAGGPCLLEPDGRLRQPGSRQDPAEYRQPLLRPSGAAVADGPVGAVGVAGAMRAVPGARLEGRGGGCQQRPLGDHPGPRPGRQACGRGAPGRRLRHRRHDRDAVPDATGTALPADRSRHRRFWGDLV